MPAAYGSPWLSGRWPARKTRAGRTAVNPRDHEADVLDGAARDCPIQVRFIVNLRTAKAPGLAIQPTLLARASEAVGPICNGPCTVPPGPTYGTSARWRL